MESMMSLGAEENERTSHQPKTQHGGAATGSDSGLEFSLDTGVELKTFIGDSAAKDLPTATAGTMLSLDEKVGKYQVRKLLGEGGMGAVYLAYDPLIEREVALKILSEDVGNSATALQRFLAEARAIGRLNSPHVVSIYDIDQWNGRYFIVMELINGGSVAGYANERGKLPWKEACDLVAQAARGLAAAHSAGMIHRDIKPENLMMTKDGQVKVVDFGLSKLLDSSQDTRSAVTKAGQILGTPQYMSPEQFEAEQTDARTDIYSLGATLYRLLTGRFPYYECKSILQMMTAHLSKPPPVPSDLIPLLPVSCDATVVKAMAKRPADRFQTALELADALQGMIDGQVKGVVADNQGSTSVDEADRPCLIAYLMEPSKLQAAMIKDGLVKAGVSGVQLLQSADEAVQAIQVAAPDLLMTALQIPGGDGLSMLKQLCEKSLLTRGTVVLNSSDSTIEQLLEIGPAGCLVLAPKKVRLADTLRIAHATGPVIFASGPFAAPIDVERVRLRVELDTGRIPAVLAGLFRELMLLHVEVVLPGARVTNGAERPHLTLRLRTGATTPGDAVAFLQQVKAAPADNLGLVAAVQVAGDELRLRAVSGLGVIASCSRGMDGSRLRCLLQASQPGTGN
jgi:serine/threonine protein kinase